MQNKRMDDHNVPRNVLLQTIQQDGNRASLIQSQDPDSGHVTASDTEYSRSSSSISVTSSRSDSPVNTRPPVRVFHVQQAVTDSLISSDPNFQAIHDAFMIQLLLIVLFAVVRDSYKTGSLFLDTTVFQVGLGTYSDIATFIMFEMSMLSWSFAIHPFFKLWQYVRSIFPVPKLVDRLFIIFYLVNLAGGLAVTIHILIIMDSLPRITTLIAGIEQFRLSMKSYSYIRENAYKVLYPWHKDDTSGPAVWYCGQMSPTVGSFKQYCYFLFAPTLLYRDHYPRTKSIRWHIVFMYAVQMFAAVWCGMFLIANVVYPSSLRQQDVVNCFMLVLIMGLLGLVLCNIAVLHSYTNLTAELMRFADRKFYDAWWTCTSFSSFYRKWNLLVHDWIHSYIYLDVRKVFSKRLAVFCTIFVSSVVHEYLLALGMGFMFPVLTSLFAGIGVFFYILKPLNNHRMSNLFILICLSLGTAIIVSLIILESASRQFCPTQIKSWFRPRLLYCYNKYNP